MIRLRLFVRDAGAIGVVQMLAATAWATYCTARDAEQGRAGLDILASGSGLASAYFLRYRISNDEGAASKGLRLLWVGFIVIVVVPSVTAPIRGPAFFAAVAFYLAANFILYSGPYVPGFEILDVGTGGIDDDDPFAKLDRIR